MAKFTAALMGVSGVRILSRESRNEMLSPQAPAKNYGIGLQLREANGANYVGHGGSVAGYNADLLFEPKSKLGVAVLRTTTYNPPTARLLEELVMAGAK